MNRGQTLRQSTNHSRGRPMNKRLLLTLLVIVCQAEFVEPSWAATTETISVTVSLKAEVSASLDSETWVLGEVSLGDPMQTKTFTATNDGNVPIDLEICASNGAGGWTLGPAAALDVFMIALDNPSNPLSTANAPLASNLGKNEAHVFNLGYTVPTADSFGGEVNQSFDITLTVSTAAP